MPKKRAKGKVTTKWFRGQVPAALALKVLIETEVARQVGALETRVRKVLGEVLRTETHKEIRRAALDEVHALLQSEAHRIRHVIEAEAPRGGLYIPDRR